VTKSGRKCWMMRPEAFRRQNEKPGWKMKAEPGQGI
jgi:hypothetical protein